VALPQALASPRVTWERTTDVADLGSGAAGLAAAIAMRPAREVLILTKDRLDAGSTAWAQGGLAAVLDPQDSIEEHVADTLAAGAGLCDEAAVRLLVESAPASIRARGGSTSTPRGCAHTSRASRAHWARRSWRRNAVRSPGL
jgi:L-aspartate oxidase